MEGLWRLFSEEPLSSIDEKLIRMSYQEVAENYRSRKGSGDKLINEWLINERAAF